MNCLSTRNTACQLHQGLWAGGCNVWTNARFAHWGQKSPRFKNLLHRVASLVSPARAEEKPQRENDQRHAANQNCGLNGIHQSPFLAAKARKRSALETTDTLERAISRLAKTGESSQPVKGCSAPAATGMPTTL